MARGLRKKLLRRLPEGVRVYEVDGRYVRDNLDTDFTLGCHDLECSSVPTGEIWVERMIDKADECFNATHEIVERSLMAQGETYGKAHAAAIKAEAEARKTGRCRLRGGR